MPDIPGVINWPASLDSLVTLLQVRDLASTTITAPIEDDDMTLQVASTSGWPATGAVTIEGEHITYTAKTSTTLTVGTRGAFTADGGSVAAAHLIGATVAIKVIAATHRVLVDAVLALQAKQGAGVDTPATGELFKGTGTGTSGWSTLAGSEVNTALGYTAASDADLDAHTAASNPHTGSQPLDGELTAIAGLISAADSLPYFTGAGVAGLATFTTAGRAIVDDADNAAQRTTLGLGSIATQGANSVAITGGAVTGITDLAIADGGTGASDAATARTNLGLAIGTDVQAQDAELQALAGLTSAADRVPYFTGAGVAGLATFTAAGRALVDDADTTTQRATLGLGSVDNTADESKPVSTAQAAANVTDRARANHTGTQLAATISDFSASSDARIAAAPSTYNAGTLTVVAGVVTLPTIPANVSVIRIAVDTEGLAAADDATIIAITGTISVGTLLVIRNASDSRVTTLVDGSPLRLMSNFVLQASTEQILLSYYGGATTYAIWVEFGRGRLVKADVGLSLVDNTADAAKPVSTAQETALDLKADLASPTFTGVIGGVTASLTGTAGVATVFNESGADSDTRIEGDTDINLVFVDASTDRVGIGNNAPNSKMDITGTLQADGLRLDVTATVATITPTHTIPININGTTYRIPIAV